MMKNIKGINLALDSDYKIIVISDMHGNYPLFYELFNSLDIDDKTYLIFNGDYINRYPYSHEMLKYLMEIKKNHSRTYFNLGNHEYSLLDLLCNFESLSEERIQSYTRGTSLWNVFNYWSQDDSITTYNEQDTKAALEVVRKNAKKELDFMKSMTLYIKTKDFIFVHAGVNKNIENSTVLEMVENYHFFEDTHNEKQIVVVGHWPIKAIPNTNSITNNVKFMLDKKMIFIDGGNSLDKVGSFDLYGQINALIINKKDNKISYETRYNDFKNYYVVTSDVKKYYPNTVILSYHNFDISISDYNEDFYKIKAKKSGLSGLLLKDFYKVYPFPSTYCGKFFELKKGAIVNLKRKFTHYSIVRYNDEFGLVNNKYLKKL